MSQNSLLGPIFLRFGFFALNLYFTIQVATYSGWGFFAVLLAIFATREFVGTVQMSQVYLHLKRHNEKKNDNKKK